jgi:hypothetical protein
MNLSSADSEDYCKVKLATNKKIPNPCHRFMILKIQDKLLPFLVKVCHWEIGIKCFRDLTPYQ